jgi:hypothetical protein
MRLIRERVCLIKRGLKKKDEQPGSLLPLPSQTRSSMQSVFRREAEVESLACEVGAY